MYQPTCSIVIVNWKSIRYLIKCIESIKCHTGCRLEIIVIDNFSGRDEQEQLRKIADIVLILNTENRGFAAANNQGFRIAKGEYIFMLNPDTIILDNAIDKLVAFLACNKQISAAGPMLFYSEKLDYHPSVKSFPKPLTQFFSMLPIFPRLWAKYQRMKFDRFKAQGVDCLWGAAILFRRNVFEKIGYFDERFFVYSEEVDFCKRMNLECLDLYYFPKAEIIHFGGKSQQNATIQKNTLVWTSKIKYFEKYFSRKNILINFLLLTIILKIKIALFKKNELSPIIKVLNEYIKCEKKY